jgi:hypothetical protein
MANGVTVIAKESRVTPAVTIHLPRTSDCVRSALVARLVYFLSRMIDRGTDAMTADAIAEALETAASRWHQCDETHAVAGLHVPDRRLRGGAANHGGLPDAAGVPGVGDWNQARRDDHVHPPGRGQPGSMAITV